MEAEADAEAEAEADAGVDVDADAEAEGVGFDMVSVVSEALCARDAWTWWLRLDSFLHIPAACRASCEGRSDYKSGWCAGCRIFKVGLAVPR